MLPVFSNKRNIRSTSKSSMKKLSLKATFFEKKVFQLVHDFEVDLQPTWSIRVLVTFVSGECFLNLIIKYA